MTAQVIFFVEKINDRDGLKAYQKAAHPTLEAAGGRVIVAYGRQEVVEGSDLAGVVVVEFPDYESAQNWYHSPGYTQAAKLRQSGAAECHAVIVEGRSA
jgi:uncharacterized protein (DUF1330 family)